MTDRDIADLCPDLQLIYQNWLDKCHAQGLKAKAIVTWRSAADQDAAKANGLSNANAGQSPHNCVTIDGEPFSKAFDFACFDENAQYITNGTDDRYRQAGEIGESLGLEWGGRWNKPDWDHLQLTNWKTGQAAPVNT